MAAMIDANVLIHLISEEPDGAAEPELNAQWKSSRELVAREGTVYVSTIVWFEAYNSPTDDGSLLGETLDKVAKHFIIEPLNVDAAERAAKLLAEKGLQVCPKCFAHPEAKSCKSCGRLVGKALKLNDALIVAHADVTANITALYTFDDGMIKLGGSTRGDLTVGEPPAASGVAVNQRYGRFAFDNATSAVPDAGTANSGDSMSIPIVTREDTAELAAIPDDDEATDS